jgi:multiple sugar transport system substrate-binding protein
MMFHGIAHGRVGRDRRQWRRIYAAGCCIVPTMALVAMVGCTPRSGESSGAPGTTNLTYSWWGGNTRTELQDGVVTLFEKKYPKISIKRTTTSSTDTYTDRLSVEMSGNNMPDMFQNQDRFLRQFAGATVPLDQYVKDGTIDVSDVPPEVLAAGKYDGKQLMIGTSFSFRGLYYDKKMFSDTGVEAPGLETTWDVLAQKLTQVAKAGLPTGTYASINMCGNDSAFYSYLRGQGKDVYAGDKLGFGKDTVEAWFSYWKNLQNAKTVPPPDVQQEQQGTTTEDSMLAKRKVGLDIIPANQYETIKDLNPNVDETSVPRGPAGSGNFLIVSGQSISRSAKDPKAAAEFINFFLNDVDAAKEYKADNGLPAANKPRDAVSEVVKMRQFDLYNEIKDQLQPMPPAPPGGASVIEALGRACDEVSFGRSSVSDAAARYMADADSALQQ